MQREGKIRHVGLSTDNATYAREFNRNETCGTIQLDYSILNRTAEEVLLPYCRAHNLGVNVRGPLARPAITRDDDSRYDGTPSVLQWSPL